MNQKQELYHYLEQFLSENKIELFEDIANSRTRFITVVLEDLHLPHNANAVLRNCECFGIQDVHIIENRNKFKNHKDIARGSTKWLDLIHYNKSKDNTLRCLQKLKKEGYKIVATTPDASSTSINDLNLGQKTALVFGTEFVGVSETVIKEADEIVTIPMFGYTESLNLSVSVAICLYELSNRLRNSNLDWKLSNQEKLDLKLKWAKLCIKSSEMIIKDYLKKEAG